MRDSCELAVANSDQRAGASTQPEDPTDDWARLGARQRGAGAREPRGTEGKDRKGGPRPRSTFCQPQAAETVRTPAVAGRKFFCAANVFIGTGGSLSHPPGAERLTASRRERRNAARPGPAPGPTSSRTAGKASRSSSSPWQKQLLAGGTRRLAAPDDACRDLVTRTRSAGPDPAAGLADTNFEWKGCPLPQLRLWRGRTRERRSNACIPGHPSVAGLVPHRPGFKPSKARFFLFGRPRYPGSHLLFAGVVCSIPRSCPARCFIGHQLDGYASY